MGLDKIIIIIPSLDPDERLEKTVYGLWEAGFEKFLLIDDGSDSDHKKPFENILALYPGMEMLIHETNLGKGRALRDAFLYIDEHYHDIAGAVTVDSDGQHLPKDVVRVAEKLMTDAGNVVLGCRDFDQEDVPKRSRTGNRTVNFVLRTMFGVSVSDSQTGLRGFPLKYLRRFAEEIEGERFEYETVMFLYMKEHGIGTSEVKISTVYEDNNSASHYSTFKDTWRIVKALFPHATFLKQVLSSLLCTVADLLIFYLISRAINGMRLSAEIFTATACARVCSSFLNYLVNKKFVFRSRVSVSKSLWKYAVLAVIIMELSSLFVTAISGLTSAGEGLRTFIKLGVDLLLFIMSYFVQKKWVYGYSEIKHD